VATPTKQKSPITRSGTRRLGDDYQDVVALEVLVDWLEHSDRYKWVRVEADDAGALDDVIALKSNGALVVRQVKYSTDAEADEDRLTWNTLLERKEAKSGKTTQSLLQKWAFSLDAVSTQAENVDAAAVSNRRPSPEIEAVLSQDGAIIFDRIADSTRVEIVRQLGDETQARKYFSHFRFRLNWPSLSDLEDGVRRRFFARGGTEQGWLNLRQELRRWVCFRHQPPPDGTITLAAIKRAAEWHQLQALLQRFEIPADYVLPSRAFHEDLISRLVSLKSGCEVLFASPGAGKSTYSSKLYDDLVERGVPAVRHHYFLSVSDTSSWLRVDHERAAESLMHDLRRDHAHALGGIAHENPRRNQGDVRKWLEECGMHYTREGKALVVLIDGLDHVWRERRSVDELDQLLGSLLPASEGVVVFLATQAVDDRLLPGSLFRAAPRERWVQLPLLDDEATAEWLGHHRLEFDGIGGEALSSERLAVLSGALQRRSKGHPLHLRYTLRAIQERGLPLDESTIESLPACPHEDITAYYAELWRGLSEESRSVLHLLAATNFPWPKLGILECQDPQGQNASRLHEAFRQVEHLLTSGDLGLEPFHSSLLVFVSQLPEHGPRSNLEKRRALEWLTTRAPEYWAWAFPWRLAADLGDEGPIRDGPTRAWVVSAMSDRRPRADVKEILSRAIRCSLKNVDLPRAVELGLLLDYWSSAHEFSEESLVAVLYPQLRAKEDPTRRAWLRAGIKDLGNAEVRLLAEAEARADYKLGVRRCFDELADRLKSIRSIQNRGSRDEWRLGVTSLLQTAALPGGPKPERIVRYSIRKRGEGVNRGLLSIYAESLRAYKEAGRLREALVGAPGSDVEQALSLSTEEAGEVLRPLVLLSFEEGINCDPVVREHNTEPLCLIYASLKKTANFTPGPVSLPSRSILDMGRFEYHQRSEEARDFFHQSFFAFLAGHLWGSPEQSSALLDGDRSTWPHRYLAHLDEVASRLAASLRSADAPTLGWYFNELARLPLPEFRGNENIGEFRLGTAAADAALWTGFDLLSVFRGAGGSVQISRADIEASFASVYSTREAWVQKYVSRRRAWMTPETVDWFLAEWAAELQSSISPFPERAERYAWLASMAAIHKRPLVANAFIQDAAENLIAHGPHKDMLFDAVLDSVRLFHSGRAAQSADPAEGACRSWLLLLAPAIAAVDKYTDGDETGHLPRELAGALAEIAPDLLPRYCRFLNDAEEYHDALHAFREFVRTADLSDPANRAIARTAVEDGSLEILAERADGGDEAASDALEFLLQRLGRGAFTRRPSEDVGATDPSLGNKGEPPAFAGFPPDQFFAYVLAVRQSHHFRYEEAITEWLAYWEGVGRGEEVFMAVSDTAARGIHIWAYDALYELAVRLYGRERAYPWLLKAHRADHGWSRYSSAEERAVRRWEVVKEYHHDLWFDFISETIFHGELWKGHSIGHGSYVLLIKYCLFMGQQTLAESILQAVVTGALELVSNVTLPTPAWVSQIQAPT
jgi:hypothetical protein